MQLPALILHVTAPKDTAPSYYTPEGLLISAMDQDDAHRVKELIDGRVLIEGFQSMHDIHDDLLKEFIQALLDFKKRLRDIVHS